VYCTTAAAPEQSIIVRFYAALVRLEVHVHGLRTACAYALPPSATPPVFVAHVDRAARQVTLSVDGSRALSLPLRGKWPLAEPPLWSVGRMSAATVTPLPVADARVWAVLQLRALVLSGRAKCTSSSPCVPWLCATAPVWVLQRVLRCLVAV
jgi:hypothetical protein